MTKEDIRGAIEKSLTAVAPEIDIGTLAPDTAFRQEFDLDSMDVLNIVIGLHATLGIEVPEADYGRLATLNSAVEYLSSRLGVTA